MANSNPGQGDCWRTIAIAQRRKQNKTPHTLASHGTLVEQPFPKELLIFSLTDCAWRIVRTHSRLRSVIWGKQVRLMCP
jgi:hypothetical protein